MSCFIFNYSENYPRAINVINWMNNNNTHIPKEASSRSIKVANESAKFRRHGTTSQALNSRAKVMALASAATSYFFLEVAFFLLTNRNEGIFSRLCAGNFKYNMIAIERDV